MLKIFLALGLLTAVAKADDGPLPSKIDFNRDIRPILSDNCYYCHGNDPKHRMADLRLDIREDALQSGAFVPGKPDSSILVDRILSPDPDELMPPPASHKKLSSRQKELLKSWIAEGAEYAPHWSFAAPKKIAVPSNAKLHPIDYFIEQSLREKGLNVSPLADAFTLMRRVSLDLTGLPPSPAELKAFEEAYQQDPQAAYHQLVERLLDSPHYGERWGRWWLDQARYADSNGYSIDSPRQIWKYRDWVIKALNEDMPFDQFTTEQLAGDLLPNATIDQQIATGFHRNTQINQEGGIDPEQFRIDSVFDRVATTGSVWLGLTIGCAQCHDHKFDPIKQSEYYRLFAFLNNQEEPTLKVFPANLDGDALAAELKELEKKLTAHIHEHMSELGTWEVELTPESKKKLPADVQKSLATAPEKRRFAQNQTLYAHAMNSDETFQSWNRRFREVEAIINQAPTTLILKESPKPRKTTVFINGDFTRPADEVTPGTPAILHALESPPQQPTRLDLARWIMTPENPLTARVIMNRIWQQYFGRGIVETENDFGLQGSPPSHPELLDWLAVTFQEKNWSLKEMHRKIVHSHTYRQSSHDRPELKEKDPNNYLLARQQRLRLDAEIVRDVALAASGLISTKIGGPSVYPPIPAGVMNVGQAKHSWNVSKGEDRYRRGMYTFIHRASPPPSLSVFDAPEGFSTCTRRMRSNTPLQALTLMNDAGFFEFATALQKIIEVDGLEVAFRRCTTRTARPEELAVLQKLDSLNAARVLLNLDETVTRE